jgi:hypothetical protein
MKRAIIMIVGIMLLLILNIYAWTVTVIHNKMDEIKKTDGNIRLTLIRVWGGDENEDENQFFKFPGDIAVDENGFVYIADNQNHRIQVFNSSGNFLRTIGRRGKGPGDVLNPSLIVPDKTGKLVVYESGNRRIQILNPSGKYIGMFGFGGVWISDIVVSPDNRLLVYSHPKTFNSGKLIYFYNFKGEVLGTIGKHPRRGKELAESEGISFVLDKKGNIYIAYNYIPYIETYNEKGKLLLIATYVLPFKTRKLELDSEGKITGYSKDGRKGGAGTMAIDENSMIYLVSKRRLVKKEEERNFGVISLAFGDGSYIQKRPPGATDCYNTDVYNLMVFNSSGKIIASCPLETYCQKIRVYGDRLFVIDSINAQAISEYKIEFRDSVLSSEKNEK